jgi:precorrin-3B C17-methyltransferase / cobalt-factor III methyltransferase
MNNGTLTIVGIGPGAHEHTTPAALAAIADAEVVVGYTTYIRLVQDLVAGKEVVRTGMTEEIGRARIAVERAQAGAKVVIISSGDAGVYGMGGLVFQVLQEVGWTRGASPDLRLIPGITALNACASLVGAPLGHDFCAISLSDLLTPWSVIERRIRAAAESDFVIGLYNPASGRRTRQIVRAHELIREHRPGTTPVALVKSAYRRRETRVLTDLDHCLEYEIGMLTTVIVGSSQSFVFEGHMVTPRGYANKYTWQGEALPGQIPGRSLNLEPPLPLGGKGEV